MNKKNIFEGVCIFIESNVVSINENRSKLFKVLLFLGLILVGSVVLSGAVSAAGLTTSPQPKFHHDNNNTGQSQYKGSQTNATKWKSARAISNSPVVGSDGTIYVGWANRLYALNRDGSTKWFYKSDHTIDTTPAIGSDGTIYVGCDGDFIAVTSSGKLKWKHTLDNYVESSPAIGKDGTIYFGCNDGSMYALYSNGNTKWTYTPKDWYWGRTGYPIYSSPAIGSDGTIYFGFTEDSLLALNPNGLLKWRYDNSLNDFGYHYDMESSPAIGSDGTIYIASTDGYLYAVNSAGSLKWTRYTGGLIMSSPSIAKDGTIYIASWSNNFYAVKPDSSVKWKFPATFNNIIASSPAIGSDGTIYIGSDDGTLYALNPTGTMKWKYKTGISIGSSPAIGSDGTIYFGNDAATMYAIGLSASASPTGGTYSTSKKVYIKTNTPATIYYTKNGTTPTTSSTKYIGAITLTTTTTLKFIAKDSKGDTTPVYTQKYTIAPKVSSTSPTNLRTGFSRTSTIAIKFTENIKASTYFNKIIIKNLTTGKTITLTKTISRNMLNLKTRTTRTANTWYTVTIPRAAIKDKAGNNLAANYTFKFKTGT